MPTYKIVVNGNILPGFEQESVKDNIARLFKLANPEQREKAFARIFSGKPMVFKKGLTQEKARAYEAAMTRAGLGCEIVSEGPAGSMELESSSIAAQPEKDRATNQEQTSNEKRNPYEQPTADLETQVEEGEFVLTEPQKVAAGGGIEWIKEGFSYFKQAPLVWILMTVLFVVISIVASFIPFASLVLNIINPVFIAGFMIACYKLTQNEEITVNDLFAGFKNKFGRLAAVGGIYLLSFIVIGVVFAGLMFGVMGQDKIVAMAQSHNPSQIFANYYFLIFLLVLFLLMLLVGMAYLFAPVLVVMHDVTAVEAMKLSFKGCLRNMLPFLLYGVIGLVLGVIAMIPVGLGYLVLMPVLTASIFAAYRQIYTETAIQ